MDQLILNLSYGLGLHHTIGWFLPIFLGTANILPSLLTIFQYADKSAEFNRVMEDKEDPLYDFIVVGGGTSGSVVANRLSKQYRVLLLERGGEPHPLTSVPFLESELITMPGVDYAYLTTSQNESCLSLNDKQSLWSAGSSLGGTSTINSMVYLRGHPYDYDIWAHWNSDKRWNYESVLPYFLKSENYCFRCESVKGRTPVYPPFHGSDGELHLQKPVGKMNLLKFFIEAFEWAGIPMVDFNAPFVRGVDGVTYAQKMGRRMSCKDAFLDPVRANLKIAKYARVYKVLFDGKQAFGVEYEQFGKVLRARVTKEVILSAGAIESPKILLLTGIGPAQDFKKAGIPLLVDAPGVGQNLQDHVGTLLGPFLINQPLSFLPQRDINLEVGEEFLANGTGPLSLSFTHGVAIFPSSKAEFVVYPDVQIGLSPLGISSSTAATLSKIYNLNLTTITQFYSPLLQQRESIDSFNLFVNYARPRSRGNLKLQSKDFRQDPIIDPNYFDMTEDLDVLVEGLRVALEIGENAPSFRKLNAQLSPFPWPKCVNVKFRSDDYLRCLAKEMTLTRHHYVGTVRMGGDGPLDSELRVKGVEGLRVVDASVMPFITSMDTMGPCIMIGERGAAFILERWGTIGGDKEVLPEQGVGQQDKENLVNYEHSFRKFGA